MIFVLVVALGTALMTWFAGWWGVAIVALVAGFVAASYGATPWRVALGAVEGWSALIVFDAVMGPFARLSKAVGGAMTVPSPLLLVVTLAFAGVLAWSSAALAAEARSATTR